MKDDNRGGTRKGAGRPRGINTVSIHLKLKKELEDYVNSKDNKNGFINDCIKKQMQSDIGKGLWPVPISDSSRQDLP